MTQASQNNPQLVLAKDLVKALESGDQATARVLTQQLSAQDDKSIYQEVSSLTRDLHQTLDELDHLPLLMQTKHDIPDAAERLQYVLDTVEEASDKTLTSAENSLALVEQLMGQNPSSEIATALQKLQDELNNIMLAQSFQDLTGQVLNRVILIISSLEQSLIALIQDAGHDYNAIPDKPKSEQELEKGIGPNVTRESKKDAVASQDDVDDLLSDLGI